MFDKNYVERFLCNELTPFKENHNVDYEVAAYSLNI